MDIRASCLKTLNVAAVACFSNLICFYHIWITREKLEAFLLRSMEDGLISDGVLAQDINQISSFWQIREVFIPSILRSSINIAVS